MSEPDPARALRHQLGHQLASLRETAGYSQQRFAGLAGYARSTVAGAETGQPGMAREFWEKCDQILGAGTTLTDGFDWIADHPAGPNLAAATMPEALRTYWQLGWPAIKRPGRRLELVTGTVIDALEVPAPAATVAIAWWQHSGGQPDLVRRLPALPPPRQALAVIIAGSRAYFLTQAGGCPWTSDSADGPGYGGDGTDTAAIRWHSGGSHIPAPPAHTRDGHQAGWAHRPSGAIELPIAAALLDLLAKAAAITQNGPAGLMLSGGVRAIPVLGK